MNKIILVAFVMLASSCGMCNESNRTLPDTIPTPVEIISGQENNEFGVLVYTESTEAEDNTLETQTEKICDFETYHYESKPIEVKRQIIPGAFSTSEEDYVRTIDTWLKNKAKFSEHVFILDNMFYTISGGTLDFIDWAIISIDNHEILWSTDFHDYNIVLNFDGAVDLREYLTEKEVSFNVEGRGRSPSQKTNVGFYIDFVMLRNCEEVNL
jgi:hypothetical protein